MNRRRAFVGALAATLLVVLSAASVVPVGLDIALDGAAVIVAYVLLVELGAVAAGSPARAAEQAPPPHLDQLDSTIRLVARARSSIVDARFRLRPVLAQIADHRLERGHGLTFDDQEPATALLGARTYLLLHESEPPEDRTAQGWSLHEIEAAIDAVERLGEE